ncbi:MAG: hypothetical protein Tsb0020_20680 [Haliangiales bacterium]
MYRDDQNAMHHRMQVQDKKLSDLEQQNEAMKVQLAHQQQVQLTAAQYPAYNPYLLPLEHIDPALRPGLAFHQLTKFPVWAVGVLNVLTLGLFPLIHFGLMNDKLPRGISNDPSAGKAIGFSFIPYFNMYWVFFSSLRLADRINLQFRLRGKPEKAPKSMMIACSVLSVIPYLNILIGLPIMWTIGSCMLQSAVNEAAELDPHEWLGRTELPPPAEPTAQLGSAAQP